MLFIHFIYFEMWVKLPRCTSIISVFKVSYLQCRSACKSSVENGSSTTQIMRISLSYVNYWFINCKYNLFTSLMLSQSPKFKLRDMVT